MIPTDNLISFLKYVYEQGIKSVTLCGGDPLTRKDIIDLLKQIKGIGYTISLDTVGTSLIKNIEKNGNIIIEKTSPKELASLVDNIGIPIDGSTTEIFKLFRQTDDDLLSEQLKICEELHKNNANICINTVVHKGNLSDVYELTSLINKLVYIKKWQIFQYAPMGKYGILNREKFEITEEEFNNYKSNVLSIIKTSEKVQFKDYNIRNKAYMIIDNSGNAWIPIYDNKIFNNKELKVENRNLIGNIKNKNDWNKICYYLNKNSVVN